MISPEEIKKLALKWWPEVLSAAVSRETCFPKRITRIGKVQPNDILHDFGKVQQELARLHLYAKPEKARGYRIHLKPYHFQRAGDQNLPDAIEFETLDDYLAFTGKQKEWSAFHEHLALILKTIPGLEGWVLENVLLLTEPAVDWPDLLQVCLYFIQHPRPELYIRQLPIQVHTKFIEQNASTLCSLLDYLIKDHIRNPKEKRVDRRYYLRFDEPLIRIRQLDPGLKIIKTNYLKDMEAGELPSIGDISMPVSAFNQLNLPVKHVVMTENKMNFLCLPDLPQTVAIWSGGGFQVGCLSDTDWLKTVKIYYWGDIDEHGFQILHQLRSYFPEARSVMMDLATLEAYDAYRGVGARNKAEILPLLTKEEQAVYEAVRNSRLNRLEQEKIDQQYADMQLMAIYAVN